MACRPRPHLLAYYQDPENFVAGLTDGKDAPRLLQVWRDAAGRLLDMVRRHHGSVTLLSLEECMAAPKEWAKLVKDRFGLLNLPPLASSDLSPVRRALARMQVEADRELRSILAELDAASTPLRGSDPVRLGYAQLLPDAWQQLSTHAIESEEQKSKLSALANDNSDLATRNSQLTNDLKELEAKLKDATEENELLLPQLHQAEEELEQSCLENRRLGGERDARAKERDDFKAKAAELEAVRGNIAAERDSIKAKLTALEAAGSKAAEERKIVAGKLKEAEAKLKDASEENELLLLQLHQVQEELEHYFLENRRLEKEKLAVGGSGPEVLVVDGLRTGHCHEKPPHRHLDFTLENARMGERKLGTQRMRLVEHNGRPGILVFGPTTKDHPPLLHWKEHGKENGAPYMLIVPQDDRGRDFLVAAPASDFLLVRDGARLLANQLQSDAARQAAPRPADWVGIARRFVDYADNASERLHYDDIKAASRDNAFEFVLHRVCTPEKGYLQSLEFVWRDEAIELIQAKGAAPPLTGWMAGKSDAGASTMRFDFQAQGKWAEQRRPWFGLTAKDRRFLKLLLAEFPNFVHHLSEQNPGLKLDPERLRETARSMRHRAAALASGRRQKRLFGLVRV